MDEKEAADECNATAEKEEGVSILHFFLVLMLFSDSTDIFRTQQVQL